MVKTYQSYSVTRQAVQMPDEKLWADYIAGHTVPLGDILNIFEFIGESGVGKEFPDGLQVLSNTGLQLAKPTDWIVKEAIDGTFYPIPDDIFQQKYFEAKEVASIVEELDFSAMSFGVAIETLKLGYRVARVGWNGKGMWLVMVSGPDDPEPNVAGYMMAWDDGVSIGVDRLLPWIGMKTADGGFVPWLASQTDILANDWCRVDG